MLTLLAPQDPPGAHTLGETPGQESVTYLPSSQLTI